MFFTLIASKAFVSSMHLMVKYQTIPSSKFLITNIAHITFAGPAFSFGDTDLFANITSQYSCTSTNSSSLEISFINYKYRSDGISLSTDVATAS